MIKNRMAMRGQGGFTLIELLVVIAILGILAGVAVFAVGSIRDNANKNACLTERSTFETAVDAASIEPGDHMSNYLKASVGKYFSVTGSTAFGTKAGVTLPTGC